MDGRYCRNDAKSHPQEHNPSFYNKKENQFSRVYYRIPLLAAVLLLTLSVANPKMFAQTIEGGDSQIGREGTLSAAGTAVPNQSSEAVSVAQLSIPAKAVKHLESAEKRFKKSDLGGATSEIDRALEIDPDCAQAFSLRAFVKLALRDFDGAIEDAMRAVALDPHDPESYLAMATAYNSTQEFSNAAEAAQQAFRLSPDAWQGQLELAKSLYGQGQYVSALNALDPLNLDFPDVHLVRADVLMRLGHTAEAVEQFRLFLKQAPDDPRDGRIRQIVANVGKNPP